MSRITIALLGLVSLIALGMGGLVYVRSETVLAKAERAYAAGRPRDALIDLLSYTRDHPKDGPAFLLLGRVSAQLGDLVAAERHLKRARFLEADRWAVLLLLGQLYLADRRYGDVLAEIPPAGPTPAITARNLAVRSRAYRGLNDDQAATQALDAARRAAPDQPEVLVATARLSLAAQDPAAAETSIDAALTTDPAHLEALQLKSQLLFARGDKAGALQATARAVAAAPGLPAPRLARANLLIDAGDDAKARADVAAVLSTQPRNAPAIFLDGVLAVRAGRYKDASERLQNLGPTGARFPRAPYFQALAALGKDLPATAVEQAERYAALAPNDPDGVRLLARAQLADRRPELAEKTLSDAIGRGMDDPQTLDQLGGVLASQGKLAAAAETYNQALRQTPDDPAILVHLAVLQARQGNAADALASLQAPGTATADNPLALEALAAAQIAAGETDKAEATLARLRPLGPTESLGVLTGMLAMARFDMEQATSAFEAAASDFPNSVVPKLNLARTLAATGQRDRARTIVAELLAKDPANIAALNSLVQLEVDAGRFNQAIRALEAARTALPGNDGLVAMLADVLLRAGDPARAIATVTRARTGGARQPLLLAALARAHAAAERWDEAEQAYRDSLELGPDPQASLALVELELRRKDLPAAQATLDAAIAATKGDFALLTRRVEIEAQATGPEAALRKAVALREDAAQMPAAAVLEGDALMRAGRPADAARAFATPWAAARSTPLALRLAEAQIAAGAADAAATTLDTVRQDPSAALLLSQLDIQARRWPAAAANLERALRARPNDPALLNNLAWSYHMTADPRARATAQRAYLQDPSPDAADTLGWIMVRQDAAAAAVPMLRQAAKQRPADNAIAYHLATALSRTGQEAEAASLLKTMLAKKQPFEGQDEAAALLAQLAPPR